MIKAIEKFPDGMVKIITHDSEFILAELNGGELTAMEVKLLNLVEPNLLPSNYQPKVEQVEIDEPSFVTDDE